MTNQNEEEAEQRKEELNENTFHIMVHDVRSCLYFFPGLLSLTFALKNKESKRFVKD